MGTVFKTIAEGTTRSNHPTMKFVLCLILILSVSVLCQTRSSYLRVVSDHLDLLKKESEGPHDDDEPSTTTTPATTTTSATTTTPATTTPKACEKRWAGISNSNIIKDRQLTASSTFKPKKGYEATDGRFESTSGYGWRMAEPYSYGVHYLQVDLEKNYEIVAIVTEAGVGKSGYVESYKIRTQKDGEVIWNTFTDPNGDEISFEGHSVFNRYGEKWNYLKTTVTARYVRILPLDYELAPTLRWDLIVC